MLFITRTGAHILTGAGLLAAALAVAPGVARGAEAEVARVPRESLNNLRDQPTHPVMDDDVLALLGELRNASSKDERRGVAVEGRGPSGKPLFRLKGEELDRLEVYLLLRDKSKGTLDELEALGFQVDVVSASTLLVQGSIPLSLVEDVASHPAVRRIMRPSYGIPTRGVVESEGDALQGTRILRPMEGLDGTGVRVGVLSTALYADTSGIGEGRLGVGQLPLPPATGEFFNPPCDSSFGTPTPCTLAHFTGDLPIAPFANCGAVPSFGFFGGVEIFPPTLAEHEIAIDEVLGLENAFPEGAAMLEVLYDIVPNARFYYGDGSTTLNLEASRIFLDARNVDMVADNVVFTDAGRFDGSSAPSRGATDFARRKNVPYLVSAGAFTPPSGGLSTSAGRYPMTIINYFNADPSDVNRKVHSFSRGVVENRDEALNFEVSSGGPIVVTLIWDDFWSDSDPQATDDLDMYLVPRSTLRLDQAVARSVNLQNGAAANPRERIVYFPQSTITPLALVIVRKSQKINARTLFTLLIEQGTVSESQYLTHGIPLNNGDALDPVVNVGHVDSTQSRTSVSPNIIPGLSPYGPLEAEGRFLKWFEDQEFVDVVGYSSVNTVISLSCSLTGVLTNRAFRGPSAAVAHLGGFTAMLRQRFPNLPANRIEPLFTDTRDEVNGIGILPNAENITPAHLLEYENHPTYLRAEPLAIFQNLEDGVYDPYRNTNPPTTQNLLALDTTTAWSHGPAAPIQPEISLPKFETSELGLTLTPSGSQSYGFWESPLLEIADPETGQRSTTLRADRLYVAEARIGSSEADPLQVPDFRLRLTSATGEESVALVIAGLTEEASNPPTTLGGKTYRLYFRPSNDAVGAQGARFAFELLHTDKTDNSDAVLVLRDLSFSELALPIVP